MDTIGDVVSRLRGNIKAVKEDTFITDRFLYSIFLKYAKMLLRRQDNENKIKIMNSLFETLPCVELEEVSTISECCPGIKTNCTIMRTKDKLPKIMEGSFGPIIRSVTTIDGSIFFSKTFPVTFASIANSPNYKYNKTKYYWVADGRIFLPNAPYEAINVEAIYEDSIAYLGCDDSAKCNARQDDFTPIPDYLYAEIEKLAMADLGFMINIPSDLQDDKQSIIRQ